MRLLPIAAAGLTLAVVAGAASITVVGASRQSAFASKAAGLERQWDADVRGGVPSSDFTALRSDLNASKYQSPWWSPTWWTDSGSALLDDLENRTTAIWNGAMSDARAKAQHAIDDWNQLAQQLGPFIPAQASSSAAAWPQQLKAAQTPGVLVRLATEWEAAVNTARTQAQTAQANARTAQLNSQLGRFGGVSGLLRQAQSLLATAQADNLDVGQLPALLAALQSRLNAGGDASAAVDALLPAVQSLQSLISLNNSVSEGLRPLLLSVDQASAESTPNAGSFQSRYGAAAGALHDARTASQLTAVQQQMSALQGSVNAELTANRCGHSVGGGKVITINLTLQEAVFYQDGCEVQAGPVTTGRPLLRTPTGTFHIFYKQSPFQFISPWPKSSPFYYFPSWTNWVMEFAGGGYFIHDAPWEPDSELGPGSENSGGASHGCVHLAHALMQWAYSWTPYGTPVIITS